MTKQKIEYKGKTYLLTYIHEHEPFGGMCYNGCTTALLKEPGKDGRVEASETTYCSHKDQFNKRIGRMVSKGRLLKKLGLNI